MTQTAEHVANNILKKELSAFYKEPDFLTFQKKLLETLKTTNSPQVSQWEHFLQHLAGLSMPVSEKSLFLRAIAPCIHDRLEQGELALLLTAVTYLKETSGVRLFRCLFLAAIPEETRRIHHYITACKLLVELHEQPGLLECMKSHLPDLESLIGSLKEKEALYLASKYPKRDLEETIKCFATCNEIVQFPLSSEELQHMKEDYLKILVFQEAFKKEPPKDLKKIAWECGLKFRESKEAIAKQQLIALIAETVRHHYKIAPYDTQLLALLALINTPEKLKGRIAQMKTGEGKSTMIAMLAAFLGCQALFVDVITSSPYLAIRDGEKYAPFFKSLGLTVSHICHQRPQQTHFHGQILYGTNTDFEFAFLRDGLSQAQLRYSKLNGTLQPRTFDAVVVDEVDNLFLDTALNSALMSLPGDEDWGWIYPSILNFFKEFNILQPISRDIITTLRQHLKSELDPKYHEQLNRLSDPRLAKWAQSAKNVLLQKKEGRDYIVKSTNKKNDSLQECKQEIVIVDYMNTGRLNEGSQWREGVHQLLQAKHNLPITPESLTAASLAHPTYFGMYHHIIGLTGTMGEAIERKEIQKIYTIDSFDVPPHFPSQRKKSPSRLLFTTAKQYEAILQNIQEIQQAHRSVLVLFKSIKDSNLFSQLLTSKNIKHQLINEVQKEEEDYLVARAGDKGVITIATNTAGRGTDILLSPQTKEAGGLHVIFTFYPGNLRVEGQGLGRAARQGQPGTGCMILSQEDETIQSLLGGMILASELSMDVIFPLLDEKRSMQVQKESNSRFFCSQKETIYFEKLKQFFDRIEKLENLFLTQDFKERFIKACETVSSDGTKTSLDLEELQRWNPVQKNLTELITQYRQGISINWTPLFQHFCFTYLAHVRKQWASFYNKLHDLDGNGVEEIRKQVEELYTETRVQLEAYLLQPDEKMYSLLKNLN